ncbi:MAG TPA: hypothetical protein VHE30_19715 [Polyangiaceae bacterium]|nr:hypothetical protein [Polyangiaceae bacterium]
MGRGGPLDHPELREVEQLLDIREIAEAQQRLAKYGDRPELAVGVSYLTARLLHARGKLDVAGLSERLRELIAQVGDFPQAAELLELATTGRRRSSRPAPPAQAAGPLVTDPGPPPSIGRRETAPPVTAPDRLRRPSPPEIALDATLAQTAARGPDFGTDPLGPPLDTSAARAASWPPKPKHAAPPTSRPPEQEPARGIPSRPPAAAGSARPLRGGPAEDRPETVRASPRAPAPKGVPHDVPMTSLEPDVAPSTRGRRYAPISGLDSLANRKPPDPAPPQRVDPRDIPRAPPVPKFRENFSLPSYAPGRLETEPEIVKNKSLLPRDAGRYSEAPRGQEVLDSGRRPSRAPKPTEERPVRETVPHTPAKIRSGGPPKESAVLPSLFEIASWIDEGRNRDAIAAINRAGPDAGPEYRVLRARALAGAGYVDQAFDALQRLEVDRDLDPELRAACARLFVELGAPDRALYIAKHALDADPDRPLIRLTYALAAVRASRRRPDAALLDQAERTLERLQGREGPLPALYQALKACIQAGAGDPERAISIAQRALGLDPKAEDALAAIAEAHARLGNAQDARQAWARLVELSSAEGEALARVLAHHGVPVQARAAAPVREPETPVFAVVEKELVSGDRGAAIRAVEHAAREAVRRMAKPPAETGLTLVATVGASFLTTAPVLSSFAPFDLSLFSVRRVEAAVDVLYGAERRPRGMNDEGELALFLGAYVGETLRMAHDAHWEGSARDPDSACLVVGERHVYPVRMVQNRLRQGRRASLWDAVSGALPRPDARALASRIENPVPTPVPWTPRAWPKPSEVGSLGRSIAKSPIGKYCEDFAEGPLDHTTASLIALDTYLNLVAPPEVRPDPDAAWMRRIAVLAGGYVGETLRELVGGEWAPGGDVAEDALAFRLVLRGSVEATPIAHVLERVSGMRSSSLVDYAKTLMRRAERS